MTLLNLKNKKESDASDSSVSYAESYVKLSKNRTIFLNEPISKDTSSAISALLLYYDNIDSESDITIFINSDGGDAFALSAMYDTIQMIQSPVKTVCLGKCYSAAAVLLAVGSKGKRYALKNSQIMIHGLQCTFPVLGETDSVSAGNYLDFLNTLNASVMKMLGKHTGKTVAQVQQDCSRDLYLTADQALEYGLIDAIM